MNKQIDRYSLWTDPGISFARSVVCKTNKTRLLKETNQERIKKWEHIYLNHVSCHAGSFPCALAPQVA